MSSWECDPSRVLVLSLKPRFAEAILDGTKTVELRRVMPRITIPTLASLYASGPERSLVGTCVVKEVVQCGLEELWARFGDRTGLSPSEFEEYFAGRAQGVALLLDEVERLSERIALDALRRASGFRPPQSFGYVDHQQHDLLLAAAP